jgi:acylphosphatase
MLTPRTHVIYAGSVQGIGFRYTAREYARRFEVTGWVKNLDDGDVEMLVEGPLDTVTQFLEAVEHRFADHIRGVKKSSEVAPMAFRTFEIEY